MPSINEIPEILVKSLPGFIGSLVSLLFVQEASLIRRLAMVAGGAAFSHFGTPWASKFSDLDAGFAGFLLGLFGMVIVGRLFETFVAVEIALTLRDWIRKMLGLSPITKEAPK